LLKLFLEAAVEEQGGKLHPGRRCSAEVAEVREGIAARF
jgi:hypothetical protein